MRDSPPPLEMAMNPVQNGRILEFWICVDPTEGPAVDLRHHHALLPVLVSQFRGQSGTQWYKPHKLLNMQRALLDTNSLDQMPFSGVIARRL